MGEFGRLVESPVVNTRGMGYNVEIHDAARLSEQGHRPLICRRDLRLKYIELHAASAFSFLRGASNPESLITACHDFDMPAMALADRDGVYGNAVRSRIASFTD